MFKSSSLPLKWVYSFIIIFLFVTHPELHAQDPLRLEQEVLSLKQQKEIDWNPYRPTILFTGSSSIRMWKNMREVFPEFQVINTGFGGSHASDLYYFLEDLVLDYHPIKTFIYEGDNDLASGKSVRKTLKDLGAVVAGIRFRYPGMPIVCIAAKPSISRWKLRAKYQRFNHKLALWAKKQQDLEFADVWQPMLLEGGQLNESLFIEDGLHMNSEGYCIWQTALAPYVSLKF